MITYAVGEQNFIAWVNNTTALIVGGVNNFPHVSCIFMRITCELLYWILLEPICAIIYLILTSLLPTMGSSTYISDETCDRARRLRVKPAGRPVSA